MVRVNLYIHQSPQKAAEVFHGTWSVGISMPKPDNCYIGNVCGRRLGIHCSNILICGSCGAESGLSESTLVFIIRAIATKLHRFPWATVTGVYMTILAQPTSHLCKYRELQSVKDSVLLARSKLGANVFRSREFYLNWGPSVSGRPWPFCLEMVMDCSCYNQWIPLKYPKWLHIVWSVTPHYEVPQNGPLFEPKSGPKNHHFFL